MLVGLWLIIGAVFGLATGLIAVRRNRTATGWFMLALVTGPIAFAVLLTRPYRDHPSFL